MPYTLEIPDYGSLSNEQRRAVNQEGAIRLAGGPGTGKSLVSLWRALDDSSGNRVLILTYTLSLEFYFRKMLVSAKSRGSKKDIKIQRSQKTAWNEQTMLSGHWNEIILDEAQDMKEGEIELFKRRAERVSFGADYRQQLYPGKGASEDFLVGQLPVTRKFELKRNYRSTQQILIAVRAFFPDRSLPGDVIQKSSVGALVQLRLCDRKDEVDASAAILKEILGVSRGNIAILVPSENKVEEVYGAVNDLLKGDTTKYSSRDGLDSLGDMGRVHVCTYKSSKGLEWDVVILPFFGGRDWWIENTAMGLNDHYVAMTRAKIQLWLVSPNSSDQTILNSAYGQKEKGPATGNGRIRVPSPPQFNPGNQAASDDDLPF